MKKLILIPALLLSSLALADNYKYEISPLLGYDSAEGNLGIKDKGYISGGLEFQFNLPDSKISPEISLFYAPNVNYSAGGTTDVMRAMFNGVYNFNKMDTIVPFAKAGVGMETYTTNKAQNEDRPFFDAGLGLKADVTKNIVIKLEAVYMLKPTFSHAGSADSNLLTQLGFTYKFGVTTREPVYPVYVEENIGIQETQEKVIQLKTIPTVVATPIVQDKYSNAAEGTSLNLDIKFKYKSTAVDKESLVHIENYAKFLKKNPTYSAKIIGYTDDIGSAKYNKKLSKTRADAVVKLLIEKDVNPSQLIAIGMGEVNPIADNKTENGRAQNRRIEAVLIKNKDK